MGYAVADALDGAADGGAGAGDGGIDGVPEGVEDAHCYCCVGMVGFSVWVEWGMSVYGGGGDVWVCWIVVWCRIDGGLDVGDVVLFKQMMGTGFWQR